MIDSRHPFHTYCGNSALSGELYRFDLDSVSLYVDIFFNSNRFFQKKFLSYLIYLLEIGNKIICYLD